MSIVLLLFGIGLIILMTYSYYCANNYDSKNKTKLDLLYKPSTSFVIVYTDASSTGSTPVSTKLNGWCTPTRTY